uniref:Putative ovule protein n=1 Tax=Solanum chacoense TaxID=4108 RepID=A0A0V0IUX1_SOLCH
MASYDWRLSFQNTEIINQSLSRLKRKIELLYVTNGNKKVVAVPHSMGVNCFLHFLKWVEAPPPVGGAGSPGWCAKRIKGIMNIGPAFLGVPTTVANILSGKDVAFIGGLTCRFLLSIPHNIAFFRACAWIVMMYMYLLSNLNLLHNIYICYFTDGVI